MRRALLRAARIILSPKEEWGAIRNEAPQSRALLTEFVLPLSCIPAVCWTLGLAMFGGRGVVARDSAGLDIGQIARGGIVALLGSVASILVLAACLAALAPLFARPRDWPRTLQVAAYSSAPVFLAGVLLILPDLVFALMLAGVHGAYLQYVGVQCVLGVKTGDAAEYVALVMVLFIIASTLLGGIGSWLGVM